VAGVLRAYLQDTPKRLGRDREGQWGIRVNDQFRLCFVWRDGGAERVEFCDHHRGRETMVITVEELRAGLVDSPDVVEPDAEPLPPIHHGEHVRDWLDQTGVTAYALAKAMRVPQTRIAEILAGRRGITADTTVRLGRAIGTSAEM
jgi:antitoxin HigA-1